MNPQAEAAIIGASIAGLFTAIGWYVTKRKEERFKRREAWLGYLQQQIEEFYGPLFGIIQQSKTVYDVAMSVIGMNKDGRLDIEDPLSEKSKIWMHFVDSYIRPLNSQASDLLRTKMYLLESSTLPESFLSFLEHVAQLEAIHSLGRQGVSTAWVSWKYYPKQFEKDVEATLDRLLTQYKKEIQLLRKDVS